DAFPLGYVPEEDGYSVVAWISSHLKPDFPGRIARLKIDRALLGQNAAVILFKRRVLQLRKFFPQHFAQKLITLPSEQLLGLRIGVSKFPVLIDGEKSICRVLQNVRHRFSRFLECSTCLVTLSEFPNL